MISSHDQPVYDESWGFRDFKLEYVSCSPGCLIYNNDIPDECLYYVEIESNLWSDSNFDGCTLQQVLKTSQCVNIQVVEKITYVLNHTQMIVMFVKMDIFQLNVQMQNGLKIQDNFLMAAFFKCGIIDIVGRFNLLSKDVSINLVYNISEYITFWKFDAEVFKQNLGQQEYQFLVDNLRQ